MTVAELARILAELMEAGMENYELSDDDGDDISEVAVVMNGTTKLVVIR